MEPVALVAAAVVVGLVGVGLGLAIAPRLSAWDERRARDRDGAAGYDDRSDEGLAHESRGPVVDDGGDGSA